MVGNYSKYCIDVLNTLTELIYSTFWFFRHWRFVYLMIAKKISFLNG